MSNSAAFLSCRVTLAGDVRQGRRFAKAFAALMPALDLAPARMLLGKKHRAFDSAAFDDFIASDDAYSTAVWRRDDEGALAHLYLRVGSNPALEEFTDRATSVVVPVAARDALLDLVRRLDSHFGVISASIAGHARRADAEKEAVRQGVAGTWPPEVVARIDWDVMSWRAARSKLVRLSPITIIGPAIWATLPPMPAFEPMPRVDDLGDCKVLTAWPTPCAPRDPAFLHATRALRAWLWPYTIQNPADHVDNDPALPR